MKKRKEIKKENRVVDGKIRVYHYYNNGTVEIDMQRSDKAMQAAERASTKTWIRIAYDR